MGRRCGAGGQIGGEGGRLFASPNPLIQKSQHPSRSAHTPHSEPQDALAALGRHRTVWDSAIKPFTRAHGQPQTNQAKSITPLAIDIDRTIGSAVRPCRWSVERADGRKLLRSGAFSLTPPADRGKCMEHNPRFRNREGGRDARTSPETQCSRYRQFQLSDYAARSSRCFSHGTSLESLSGRPRFTNILTANEVMAGNVKPRHEASILGGLNFIDSDHFDEV